MIWDDESPNVKSEARSAEIDAEEEFLHRGELFEAMLRSEAWGVLRKIGLAQQAQREKLCGLPDHERAGEGRPSLEYIKGVVYGVRLLLSTPELVCTEAARIRHERQIADEESRTAESDANSL